MNLRGIASVDEPTNLRMSHVTVGVMVPLTNDPSTNDERLKASLARSQAPVPRWARTPVALQ